MGALKNFTRKGFAGIIQAAVSTQKKLFVSMDLSKAALWVHGVFAGVTPGLPVAMILCPRKIRRKNKQ